VWELSNETAVHDILLDAEMLWQEGGTSPAQDYLLAFYQQLKSWLPDHKRKINLIVFFQTQDPRKLPAFRATGSMFKVLKKEFPSSLFRLVEFQEDSVVSLPKLVAELNLGQSAKTEAVYRAGKRFEYRIEPAEPHSSTLAGAGNGPVLITGGAGAMGLCFAESLLQESENKVILTGRKAFEMLPEPVRLKIKRWGERASYFQSDVSNPASLSRLGDQIKAQFGALGGIVHSAGLVRDAMFKNKSEEVFASVLMPKVQGSQNLEALVQRFRPAWVMLCSSIGALEGQMGQSDYACANRFMDEWVKQKSSSATQYHSVNWPYWQEGGMQLPPHFVAAMEKAGIKGISNEEGKAAFRAALQAQETQTILFKGSADGTATFFPDLKEKPAATQAAPVKLEIEFTGDDPAEWVKQYLAHLLAENTSIDIAEIEYDAEMEDFGIDSIVVMKMLDALELVFPDIPRSIFFEYRTIGDLSDHLAAAFPEQAAALGKGAPMKPAEANASLPTAAETSAPNTALPPENASPVPPSSSPQPIPDTSNPGPSSPIRFTPEEVKTFLVNTLAEATSLTPDEIDPEAELEDYGLDSVVITQLTEKLELKFGEIPKTLFFEYHTLEDLAAAIAEVARGPADPDAATTYFQVIQELNPGRKFQLDLQTEAPLINGHVVADALLFPGAGYMALVSALYPGRLNYFQNVSWTAPLYPEKLSAPVQLEFSPSGGLDKFSVSAGTQHFASGKTGVKDATYAENLSLMDIAGPDWETISGTEVYQWFRQHRFQYGEAYRLIQEIKVGQGQCLGRLRLSHLPAKGLAPNALDNAFQCLIGLTIKAEQETDSIWVPFLLEEAWVYESHWPEELWVWVQYQPTTRQSSIRKFNLTLVDANGRHLMFCKNFSIKAFAQPTVSTNGHGQEPAKAERKLPAIRSYEELLDLLQRQEISAEEAVELEKTYLL
jgi:acyl carrier protein